MTSGTRNENAHRSTTNVLLLCGVFEAPGALRYHQMPPFRAYNL